MLKSIAAAVLAVLLTTLAACGGGGGETVVTRSCPEQRALSFGTACEVTLERQLGAVVDVDITARVDAQNLGDVAGWFEREWHVSFDGGGYEFRRLRLIVLPGERLQFAITLQRTFTVTGDNPWPVVVGLASFEPPVDVPSSVHDIVVQVTQR